MARLCLTLRALTLMHSKQHCATEKNQGALFGQKPVKKQFASMGKIFTVSYVNSTKCMFVHVFAAQRNGLDKKVLTAFFENSDVGTLRVQIEQYFLTNSIRLQQQLPPLLSLRIPGFHILIKKKKKQTHMHKTQITNRSCPFLRMQFTR